LDAEASGNCSRSGACHWPDEQAPSCRVEAVGEIVVLNGPSSAGKTTIALAVRDRLAPSSAVVSLDHFFPCVHPAHPKTWRVFSTLAHATFATAVSLASGGLSVVVDTVFERPESLQTARQMLAHRPYFLVAITCPVEILESRERARGD